MTIVDDIKARLDLVDIVGEYLPLRRAGKNLQGLCPFHNEKTGSFIVFPESQRWHCFGACQEGGDLFSFVMKREGWDFAQTLKHLARKAGVELRPQTQEEQKRDEIRKAREDVFGEAMTFFVEGIRARGEGWDYALSRGWSEETIRDSGVGYFGKCWDELRAFLQAKGVDLESPAAAALVGYRGDVAGWAKRHDVQAARQWVDDGRVPAMPPEMLIYPHLRRGRVTYLAGRRIAGEGPKSWNPPVELAGERQPFLNHVWFGKREDGDGDRGALAVIVEGQGDGVTLGEWGIPALALAGLALGEPARRNGHDPAKSPSSAANCLLSELKRKSGEGARLIIGLDADEAGKAARGKLASYLMGVVGLTAQQFSVVDWSGGVGVQRGLDAGGIKDANDLLRAGVTAESIRTLLEGSPTWLQFLIWQARIKDGKQDEEAVREVFAALARLDIFEVERLREDIAESLAIKRRMFDGLLRAARREAGLADDGQPRYFIEGGRIFSRYYDQGGNEILDPLCNFEALIKEDVLRDNGQDVIREFRLNGKIGKRSLSPARVKADEFSKMDWVLREWGSQAIIEAGMRRKDQLRTAIQYLSREVEMRVIYTHTGWREVDGKRVYLSALGAVGAEGIEVELDQDLDQYQIPITAEDPEGAMRESLAFLDIAPDRATFPLWGAMWLAPLRELINVAFALWVFGATGTMKSTLAACALNHYGAGFDDKHLPAGFTDTANRIEQKAFVIKDAPLVVDDFAPQKDSRSFAEYTRAAHRIIRDVGNLTGRGRLNADATARTTYIPRSLVIITGEDVPESESIMARLFVVELDKGDVNKELLTAFQAQREKLPHAMSGYLAWLAEGWGGLQELVPRRWREYRARAFADGLHLRLPEAVAGLYLGIEMGLRYAVNCGVIHPNDIQGWMDRGWAALTEGATAMVQRVQEEKPEELFVRTLRDLLTQGKIFLKHRDPDLGRPPLGGPDDRSELLGWYDADFLYLLPDAAYNRIARHFRDQGNVFPVREQTLRKMLEESGVLVSANGRRARSEWLDGRTQRVLVLKRILVEGQAEGDRGQGSEEEDGRNRDYAG